MFNYNCDLDLDLVTILHMGWPKSSTSWELMSPLPYWLCWRGGPQRSPAFWWLGPACWKSIMDLSNENTSSSRWDNVVSRSGFIAKLMSKGKKTFPPISPSKSIGISEFGVEVGTNVLSRSRLERMQGCSHVRRYSIGFADSYVTW